ncbi:MAG: hypothetical protein A2X32_03370 [Elusimicrobia bacterium GWC2_64_44]|nr:MAG: hypothetical protein A2X32_03370 [Elusimicrobia bacterium GWC2_64_44]
MNEELKLIQCDDKCGFQLRSHDEKEIMDLGRIHMKNKHNMTPSDAELRAKMTIVPQTAGSKR